MGGDITSIALQSMFQRQAQDRQFRNQAALSMLNSFLTGVETARTPQEVKKTYSILNKSFREFTKGMPGGPMDLVSGNDLENIQRLVAQQSDVSSEIARMTAEQVGGLMGGRLDFDVAMNNVSSGIKDLAARYGQAEVSPFAPQAYQAIIQTLQLQRANEASMNNLKAALAPNISSIIARRPELAGLVVDFNQKLDANAKATLMLQRGLRAGTEDELLAHWTLRGNLLSRSGKSVDKLSPDESLTALELGQREWTRDLEDTKRHLQNRFYRDTLPAVESLWRSEAGADVGLLVSYYNQFFSGSDRISPVAYRQYDLGNLFEELANKYATGEPTSDDANMVSAVAAGMRNAKVLDTPDKKFSEMTTEEWNQALADGVVDDRMDQITGPDGTTMRQLIFDETGAVRPWSQHVLELDLNRLARGDRLTWDVAKWLATGADYSQFETKQKRDDGQTYGPREALLEVSEKSPDTYARVMGDEVSGFFGGISRTLAPLGERLKFALFGGGGTQGLTQRDGRYFEPARTVKTAGGSFPMPEREITGEELRRRQAAQAIHERRTSERSQELGVAGQARQLDDLESSGDVPGLSSYSSALMADWAPRTDISTLARQILSQTQGELDRGTDLEVRAARLRESLAASTANQIETPQTEEAKNTQQNPLAGGAGGLPPTPPIAIPKPRGGPEDLARVTEIGQQKVRPITIQTPGAQP